MIKKLHEGAEPKVVDAFHAVDLGAPFKVILRNCVTVEFGADGEIAKYHIPDFEGLVRIVIMTRLAEERKLSGAELKYLRKAAGVKQVELARVLEFQPEHLSKVEADKHPLSPTAEKVARMFLFKAAAKHHKMKEGEEKALFNDLLEQLFSGLKPVAAFEAKELELEFYRAHSSCAANDDEDDSDNPCAWAKEPEAAAC